MAGGGMVIYVILSDLWLGTFSRQIIIVYGLSYPTQEVLA